MCLHQLCNKKSFSDLFVKWAGQMSANQTGPKKRSKIQSYKFLTFFYCIADVAKGGGNI